MIIYLAVILFDRYSPFSILINLTHKKDSSTTKDTKKHEEIKKRFVSGNLRSGTWKMSRDRLN